MGHFLSKEHQKALLRGGKDSLQCKAAKIAEHRKKVSAAPSLSRVDHTASSSGGTSDAATDAATHKIVPAVKR